MSRSKFLNGILALALLTPVVSHADWTGNQELVEVYVHANAVVVRLTNNPSAGCASNAHLSLEPAGDPLFKEKYSLLLAAKMAGKKVDVYLLGCGVAQPSHPRILYVRVNE